MIKLTLSHVICAGEDYFWSSFFDPIITRRVFVEGLGFLDYQTLEQRETGEAIVRRVFCEPKVSLPAPLKKLTGARFTYEDEGRFDKATRVWTWTMKPNALADKIDIRGTMRAVSLDDQSVRREIEITIEAKVPIVGGLIEETFRRQLLDGWSKGAAVQNEWLRNAPA